jgi:DHA1 family tetracycline resistance protein-like MFS transporter
MAIWVLMGLSGPSLSAIMSKKVGPSEQGEQQGALASLNGVASVIAPPILANLFGYFTSDRAPIYFPGSAFFISSVCLALSAAVFAWSSRSTRPEPAVGGAVR